MKARYILHALLVQSLVKLSAKKLISNLHLMCQEKSDTFEENRTKGKRITFIFDMCKRPLNSANITDI